MYALGHLSHSQTAYQNAKVKLTMACRQLLPFWHAADRPPFRQPFGCSLLSLQGTMRAACGQQQALAHTSSSQPARRLPMYGLLGASQPAARELLVPTASACTVSMPALCCLQGSGAACLQTVGQPADCSQAGGAAPACPCTAPTSDRCCRQASTACRQPVGQPGRQHQEAPPDPDCFLVHLHLHSQRHGAGGVRLIRGPAGAVSDH